MEENDILRVKEDLREFVKEHGNCELSNLATRPYKESFDPQNKDYSEEDILRFLQKPNLTMNAREYVLQMLADKTCQKLDCSSTQVKIVPELTDFSIYNNAGNGLIEFPSNVTDFTEVLHEMNRSLHLHYTTSLVSKFFTDYDNIPEKDKALVAAFMMDSISLESNCGTSERDKDARTGLNLVCAEKFAIDNTVRQMKEVDAFHGEDKLQIKEADRDFCGFIDNNLYSVCREIQDCRSDVFNSGFARMFNPDGTPRIRNTFSILGDIIDDKYSECFDQFQLTYKAPTFDAFVEHLERVYIPVPVYNPDNLDCPEECASIVDLMGAADIKYVSDSPCFEETKYL